MKLKTNCGEDRDCGCNKHKHAKSDKKDMRKVRIHLSATEMKPTTWEGNEIIIVPVVMARAGVVMNGSLTAEEELVPESWDGVPVTVQHPTDDKGGWLSAQTPETLTKWSVGRIFNSKLEDGALKGEAWIEVKRAQKIAPNLLSALRNGEAMDVSTGYFCLEEEAEGVSNGREYASISRDIKPNHLALLPGVEGACNWKDGCGVRANQKELLLMKLNQTLAAGIRGLLKSANVKETPALTKRINAVVAKANERSADDDPNQIVADLISNDASPFTTEDEGALKAMSAKGLAALAAQFLTKEEETPVEDEVTNEEVEDEVDNEGDDTDEEVTAAEGEDDETETAVNEDEEEEKKVAAANRKKTVTVNADELDRLVSAGVEKALAKALPAGTVAALQRANASVVADKAALVKKIQANSSIPVGTLKGMSLEQLEGIANGLKPVANFGGIALPDFDDSDDEAAGMVPPSAREAIANRRNGKKKEAH